MTFLNPWAFLFILIFIWIFKNLLFDKYEFMATQFINEHKRHLLQSKLLAFALLLMLLALTRPAIKNEITQEKFEANEYIIALDASYSMQMDDLKPSRYSVARKNILNLLKVDSKDRFTLFVFTKNPLLICPPTTDMRVASSALESIDPKYILSKSTSLESLVQRVATLEQEHKSLLIFSDGGDEHNLASLLTLAKKSAITINIVATASSKGAVITKDGSVYKDAESHLVISRINPILKDLAQRSSGFYFELTDSQSDISSDILSKLQEQNSDAKELSSDVISYKEYYFIPLLIAFIVIFVALTRVQKLLPFLVAMAFVYPQTDAKASLLDFHYLKVAKDAYTQGEYPKAAEYFKKVTPSQYSYMSLANAYYKNKQYKFSLRIYSQIKSKNPFLKSILFYNMANAAVRLKKYQRAEEFYKQSLALNYSKEAEDNLLTIYRLNLKAKVNVADMLPTANDKTVKNITKKIDKKHEDEESGGGGSKASQRSAQGSQGGGGQKSNKKQSQKAATLKGTKNEYKMGDNAYELINKGYVNEKNPW